MTCYANCQKEKKQISSTLTNISLIVPFTFTVIIEGTTEKVLQLNVYNQNSAIIKQNGYLNTLEMLKQSKEHYNDIIFTMKHSFCLPSQS